MLADAVIVGNGTAGLSTSIHLRGHGLTTVVLGRARATHKVGEVLAPIAKDEFARLGILGRMRENCSFTSAGVSVWWGGLARRDWDYIFDPHGSGWHLDKVAFEGLLTAETLRLGTLVQTATRIHTCWRDGSGRWTVEYSDADDNLKAVSGRIFVNAAGRSAQFSSVTGTRTYDDRLMACYCYFKRDDCFEAWEPRFWVEATPHGWWYSAPLPHSQAVAVFLTDSDLVVKDAETCFWTRIQDAPNTLVRLQAGQPYGKARYCSARSGICSGYKQPASLSVGDAAFTSDPIRGHGLLQAMRQSAEAAEVVARYLGGDGTAILSFEEALRVRYRTFRAGLHRHYSAEDRWQEHPFWVRRRGN